MTQDTIAGLRADHERIWLEPRSHDDCCGNCGGEGVIYMCLDEIGCVDPESGCDLCERRCDWCRPLRALASADQTERKE